MLRTFIYGILLVIPVIFSGCGQTDTIWLDGLNIRTFSDGIPSVAGKTTASGDTMQIAGNQFFRGVGVQTISALSFQLNGEAKKFTAEVGVDDSGNSDIPVQFFVIADRKILFESGEMRVGDAPKKVDVNLKGVRRLALLVTDNVEKRSRTYCNWADAKILMNNGQMPENIPNSDEKYILTPKPGKEPKINSAKIFGVTPGNPFLYTIAASGDRPMMFSAENLPAGLFINPKTGIISGKINKKGTYHAVLKAKNEFGETAKPFKIVVGETIALTPPIGWNGWNSWARDIDREKVIVSAVAMVEKGLSNHGWTYVNIDDCWQGQRGGKLNALQPNEKFPRFREMVDTIHSMGLKVGLYSTPWISSYAGFAGASSDFESGIYPDSVKNNKREYRYVGKYRFENEDARQMAEWGVDYLKYDWRIEQNSAERMAAALKNSGRDIFYSISNSAPFENAEDWARICNAWRTGPDIRDSWLSLYISSFTIDKWAPFAGPGHWNDPDMLIIGNVTTGTAMHPTRLTPDEQYSHVSLFSLLAAPLLIGCPIDQLDDFTLNLISNDEVIEINQDPLGKPGRFIKEQNGVQVWIKQLESNELAVGLFNVDGFMKTPQSYFRWGDEQPKAFNLNFQEMGLDEKYKIRDVWRQKDLGDFERSFSTEIPHHGVVFIRLTASK